MKNARSDGYFVPIDYQTPHRPSSNQNRRRPCRRLGTVVERLEAYTGKRDTNSRKSAGVTGRINTGSKSATELTTCVYDGVGTVRLPLVYAGAGTVTDLTATTSCSSGETLSCGSAANKAGGNVDSLFIDVSLEDYSAGNEGGDGESVVDELHRDGEHEGVVDEVDGDKCRATGYEGLLVADDAVPIADFDCSVEGDGAEESSSGDHFSHVLGEDERISTQMAAEGKGRSSTEIARAADLLQPDLSRESDDSNIISDQWRTRFENNRSVLNLCQRISQLHLEKKKGEEVFCEVEESLEWDFTDIQIKQSPCPTLSASASQYLESEDLPHENQVSIPRGDHVASPCRGHPYDGKVPHFGLSGGGQTASRRGSRSSTTAVKTEEDQLKECFAVKAGDKEDSPKNAKYFIGGEEIDKTSSFLSASSGESGFCGLNLSDANSSHLRPRKVFRRWVFGEGGKEGIEGGGVKRRGCEGGNSGGESGEIDGGGIECAVDDGGESGQGGGSGGGDGVVGRHRVFVGRGGGIVDEGSGVEGGFSTVKEARESISKNANDGAEGGEANKEELGEEREGNGTKDHPHLHNSRHRRVVKRGKDQETSGGPRTHSSPPGTQSAPPGPQSAPPHPPLSGRRREALVSAATFFLHGVIVGIFMTGIAVFLLNRYLLFGAPGFGRRFHQPPPT